MSRRYAGSVRRLRAIVRDAPDVGRVEVMTEDVRRVLSTLDALDLTATRLESERDAHRTRADAAEADRDALRAECERLRAIVEGSTTAPTDAEMREHMDSGGAWLVTIPARRQVRLHPETRYVDQPRAASLLWWTEGARWVAVRDGRPCAWPVTPPTARVALPVAAPVYEPPGCHSDDDGDCVWAECPQLRDNEPRATGRHCPRDLRGDE